MRKTFLFLFLLSFLLTGCRGADPVQAQSAQIFAMDTVMDISVYADDPDILDEAASLITHLEQTLSVTDPGSEIFQLNQTGSAALSPDAADLLEKSLSFCEKTGGQLDLSIYPVVRAWGFTTGEYRIPSQQEREALLENVDYRKIEFDADSRSVSLPRGMEIDFGSVAKGYTGDRLIQFFRDKGIASALLNLGGNVQTLGSKPDGTAWRIGIQDPLSDNYIAVVSVTDQAVITSGGYERFFTDDAGNTYWHIIDPHTGAPARKGLLSATAISPRGVYCDALSTSLFIMGAEEAAEFWRENRDFDMVLITEDQEVLITPGLTDRFQLLEDSSYTMAVIPDA